MERGYGRRRPLVALIAAVMLAAGCSHAPVGAPGADTGGGAAVTVLAAASLTESFEEIADLFEAAHPGTSVSLGLAGSQTLVDQLDNGAQADVLATADETSMARAQELALVDQPRVFTSNQLTLITPAGNPAHVTGMDASLEGARLVVCAQDVPCGRATRLLAARLGVVLRPVSEEDRVTEVRARVESGEADAGIVYRSDAVAAGDRVETVEIPSAGSAVNRYPIAVVRQAEHPEPARQFLDLVLSAQGQKVLARHGFERP